MSRSKKNITSINDSLTEENKMLRSLNKELSRQLKQLEKDFNVEKIVKAEKKNEIPEDDKKCPICGKGGISEVDLGIKKMVSCSLNCGYKKIIKA